MISLADRAHRLVRLTAVAASIGVENFPRVRNGLPAKATNDDKLVFATHCLDNYKRQNWNGESLPAFLAKDFANFNIEDFKQPTPTSGEIWVMISEIKAPMILKGGTMQLRIICFGLCKKI